jgi:hypothetical protein
MPWQRKVGCFCDRVELAWRAQAYRETLNLRMAKGTAGPEIALE